MRARSRPRRVAMVALLVAAIVPLGCGANPRLQRSEVEVLRNTCVDQQLRAGKTPLRVPPEHFMSDFVRAKPHDDHGPNVKDVFDRRCMPSTSRDGSS